MKYKPLLNDSQNVLYYLYPLGICQIRIDFDNFVLAQPDATTLSCNVDTITFTSPTGNGIALPTLCGTLTGQHSKALIKYHTPSVTHYTVLKKLENSKEKLPGCVIVTV